MLHVLWSGIHIFMQLCSTVGQSLTWKSVSKSCLQVFVCIIFFFFFFASACVPNVIFFNRTENTEITLVFIKKEGKFICPSSPDNLLLSLMRKVKDMMHLWSIRILFFLNKDFKKPWTNPAIRQCQTLKPARPINFLRLSGVCESADESLNYSSNETWVSHQQTT